VALPSFSPLFPEKGQGRDTRLENLCPYKNYVFVSFLTKTKFLKKHKFSSGKPSFSSKRGEKGWIHQKRKKYKDNI